MIKVWKTLVVIVCAVLFYLSFPANCSPGHAYNAYPWGTKSSTSRRQVALLGALRQQMDLYVDSDLIDNFVGSVPQELRGIHVSGGNRLTIAVRNTNQSEAAIKPLALDINSYETDVSKNPDALSRYLSGYCSLLPDQYWNYELCHKIEVRQVHFEIRNNKVVRDPDWSLGHYTQSLVIRDDRFPNDLENRIVRVVDTYSGGQRCDETGDGRSTNVELMCCENTPGAIEAERQQLQILKQQTAGKRQSRQLHNEQTDNSLDLRSFILSVVEHNICQYNVTVCVPKLCFRNSIESKNAIDSKFVASSSISADNVGQDIVSVMEALNNTCLHKQVDWWTYEFCFSKGVRQFHQSLENVKNENGGLVQKHTIQSQYILGIVTNSTALYKNESLLNELAGIPPSVVSNNPLKVMHERLSSSKAGIALARREDAAGDKAEASEKAASTASVRIPSSGLPSQLLGSSTSRSKPSILKFELGGGTLCDLEHVNRSSSIEIFCHDREELIDVSEDRTCHYLVKVGSTLLCKIPSFVQNKTKVSRVVFHLDEKSSSTVNSQPLVGRTKVLQDKEMNVKTNGEKQKTPELE